MTPTLRVAVVSDIHGNLPALKAVMEDISRHGADLVVNCGDLLSGPLWPLETAELLAQQNWPTISGNHERQLLACASAKGDAADQFAFNAISQIQRAWLARFPNTHTPVDGVRMVHGRPGTDLEYLLETVAPDAGVLGARMATTREIADRLANFDAPDLLLCGHSHQPRALRHASTLIVNPGSVGLPAFDDDHGGWHVIETGSPHARYALCERRSGLWNAALIAVNYEWEGAVAKALAAGFTDWARWLGTGRARLV